MHSGARPPHNTADQLRGPRRPLAIADLVSCIRLFDGPAIVISCACSRCSGMHCVSSLSRFECDERTRWAVEGFLGAPQLPALQRRTETEGRGSSRGTLHAYSLTAAPINLRMDIMVPNANYEVDGLAIADIPDSLPIDVHANPTPTVHELGRTSYAKEAVIAAGHTRFCHGRAQRLRSDADHVSRSVEPEFSGEGRGVGTARTSSAALLCDIAFPV